MAGVPVIKIPATSLSNVRRCSAVAPRMVAQDVASGSKHLSEKALEKAKAGNKLEKMKLAKDGSVMWTEVHELAALLRSGQTKWEDINTEDIDSRLKWAGLFHRRKRTPGRFMMRLKVPNGILNSEQLRFFHKVLVPYGDDGCADITTRMNIQLRGITLDDASMICNGLYDVGLTSFMSGMDNVRNMVGSPIAGIDPHEIVDTRQLCIDINNMVTDNRRGRAELSNLPRKFNIAVSGSRDDFAHTHINDIGLVPMPDPVTGAMGFNVIVGGFFSIKRNETAIPLDAWVPYEDVTKFCESVLFWFRDNGDRANRQKARLMYMIDQLGAAGLKAEIEKVMGKVLRPSITPGPEYDTPWIRRNVSGIHDQKQEGYSWVCPTIPAGRLATEDFATLAELADKYTNGEVRLTVEQDVLFPNVKNEELDELLAHPFFEKYPIRPGAILGGLVSCTGSQFCGVAMIETKNRAIEFAKELDKMVELTRDVRMHWTGCPNSCGQVQCADIGLMGTPAKKDGKAVEGVHIYLGGKIGEGHELGKEYKKRIPAMKEDLIPELVEILVTKFGAKLKADV